MPLISKPNYNQIFASQAPEQDKPAVFNNYPEGWGPESRPNNGKPTIKGFNYLQQTSDLKDLWILQNGACLPYDESIEYAEGAPVLKDGVIQYKTAGGFSPAISEKPYILNYFTEGASYPLNARVTLDNGDIVKSTVADNVIDPNEDMTGWVKVNDASQIFDGLKSQHSINLSIINYVNPKVFGAKGDGITDDTQAIKDCFGFMLANNASFYDFSESPYLVTSDITVEAPNKTVNIATNCKLVSDTSILRIRGTVEEIGTITTAANKGSISITSGISVNAGDVIAIHNTTDNSFFNNAFASRQYYKDGEFKTVESVSGGIVKFTTPLESSYAAAGTNKIYKVNPVKLLINGLSVESNGVCAAILSLGYKSEIVNMNGYNLLNANNSSFAVQLERFYASSLIGGEFIKKGIAATSGGATDYGLAISNCQDLNAMPRYAYGGRHGITVGGGPSIAGVPNRRVFIESATIENDPSSDLQAADFHGNVADSHYKNCIIRGRISLSGYNARSIQNKFYLKADETRPPVGLTEVIGGYIESVDDEVVEGGACAYFMSWTTSNNTALMKEDATISIKNGSIKGNATLVGFLPIFNTSVNTRYVIDGFDIKGAVPATFNRVISYAAGSAALKPAYIQATRPNFPISDTVNPIFGDANLAGIPKRVYPLSGSNANGSWTKMEDGTLICRHNITATLPITTAVNGGFKSSDIPWTYPKPFIEKPALDSMVFDNSSASIHGTSAGATAAQVYSFSTVSVASAGVNFDVKATGKYLY